jgi:hypothetical protein
MRTDDHVHQTEVVSATATTDSGAPSLAQPPSIEANNNSGIVTLNQKGDNTINGYIAPSFRVITQQHANAAKYILRAAPAKSKAYVVLLGTSSSSEIEKFFLQLYGIFDESGNWQMSLVSEVLNFSDRAGGGIGCSIPHRTDVGGGMAEKALAAAGYPCTHEALVPDSARMFSDTDPDIYISIGTRIIPPE